MIISCVRTCHVCGCGLLSVISFYRAGFFFLVCACISERLNPALVLLSLPKTSSVCPPLLNLIRSTTLDSMLEVDKVKPLQCVQTNNSYFKWPPQRVRRRPPVAILCPEPPVSPWQVQWLPWLRVMPEHVGLYLVRDLMAPHWGCLSHRQPHWRHCGRWKRESGGRESRGEGMGAGSEESVEGRLERLKLKRGREGWTK